MSAEIMPPSLQHSLHHRISIPVKPEDFVPAAPPDAAKFVSQCSETCLNAALSAI